MISFYLAEKRIDLEHAAPTTSVLDFLRQDLVQTGSKEGCAAGDCGACTAIVAETNGDNVKFLSINTCITPLATLHGKVLFTVEHLAEGTQLHPVQQAMMNCSGAQCGFCTPGFIMSLALWHRSVKRAEISAGRKSLEHALAGNLCRCTGYAPIVRAALTSIDLKDNDSPYSRATNQVIVQRLKQILDDPDCPGLSTSKLSSTDISNSELSNNGQHFFLPRNLAELMSLWQRHPDAQLIAGATDKGLDFTQKLQRPNVLLSTLNVAELTTLNDGPDALEIGAGLSFADLQTPLAVIFPDFGEMLYRLGSQQIRNRGTLAGNLASASPIGDSSPVLLALNATLQLCSPSGERSLGISDFFIGYRKTALKPLELIKSIVLPKPNENGRLWVHKLSKRFDDDISTVCLALYIELDEKNNISVVRLALGGMAATPKRALATEAVLVNRHWDRDALKAAKAQLQLEFNPQSDVRASAGYRSAMASNLLDRCWQALSGEPIECLPSSPDAICDVGIWQTPKSLQVNTTGIGVGKPSAHESALKHVTGAAPFIDDCPNSRDQLHAAVGLSPVTCGRIKQMDLTEVTETPGVAAVITLDDVPGLKDIGPVFPGDPLLADQEVLFHGQPLFALAAESYESARLASQKGTFEFEETEPLLDPLKALEANRLVRPSIRMQRGEVDKALEQAPHILEAQMHSGGQEHYYLEGQVSIATPTEGGGMFVRCSTQHPSEVQKLVSEVLHVPISAVVVETRRMGGAFGGKETHAAQWACIAAVLAVKTQKSVKLRLPREQDMKVTGKRHPFASSYRIGVDASGRLLGAEISVTGDCGCSPDLSDAIVDRAMFHADNAYYLPTASIQGHRAFTNKVSHTAFRGFGGPQGMLIIERAMDDIARKVGKDPLEIRKANLYGHEDRNITPYHQQITSNTLSKLVNKLEIDSDYWSRRAAIKAFNLSSNVVKKGLALTPVKFGISFTVQHLNQAGALIHLYTDGSVQLNHGGTEMGQGLNTKVAQVVSEVLQIDIDSIQITATRTDKVPNTSPTAASSGSDLNGHAARAAAMTLKQRLIDYLMETYDCSRQDVSFANNQVRFVCKNKDEKTLSFAELVNEAYMARVNLSANGFYRTPKIHYDRKMGRGQPFYYFATGAAVSEVSVDITTGEYRVDRVDILHDVGRSLNPALDIGQIEGGFIQGMGWLTSEDLSWNDQGQLQTVGASTYKIPTLSELPPVFNVQLMEDRPNEEDTVFHSKAVGEPPLMLGISVWSALRDAVSSLSDYRLSPNIDPPATPERVYWGIQQMLKS